MSLLGIIKIDKKLSTELKKHLEDLHTKLATEEAFDQAVIDEICCIAAWCRIVLSDAIDEIAPEKKRLAEDVFTDRIIHSIFTEIRGDETAFPQRVYDNLDAVHTSYCAGQRGLDNFEQDMCREWNNISRMNLSKRKDFVLLARRKMLSTIAELDKTRVKAVEESKKLELEIKSLQSTLRMKHELIEATEETHNADEVQ